MPKAAGADSNSNEASLRRARRHVAVLCTVGGCGNRARRRRFPGRRPERWELRNTLAMPRLRHTGIAVLLMTNEVCPADIRGPGCANCGLAGIAIAHTQPRLTPRLAFGQIAVTTRSCARTALRGSQPECSIAEGNER